MKYLIEIHILAKGHLASMTKELLIRNANICPITSLLSIQDRQIANQSLKLLDLCDLLKEF